MRMMAREGRLGKPHRQDWPAFLNRLVPGAVWQALAAQRAKRPDPRLRWSRKYIVLCWIAMGFSLQGPLRERFREGRELLAGLFYRRRRPGSSYQGLLKASEYLGIRVFQQFWACVRKTIPARLGALWQWHGWSVLAVDGSRVDAPRTRANERGLGRAGRDFGHPAVVDHLAGASAQRVDLELASGAGHQQRTVAPAPDARRPARGHAAGRRRGLRRL